MGKTSIIITTISHPTKAILNIDKLIKKKKKTHTYKLVIIADSKSPLKNKFKFAEYLSLNLQKKKFSRLFNILPFNNYARKNLGYLHAINKGSKVIIDTDDDNFPYKNFLNKNNFNLNTKYLTANDKWINIYQLFCKNKIWPRGFPLEKINLNSNIKISKKNKNIFSPIHQSLADEDPDVDAIYRFISNKKIFFKKNKNYCLGIGYYCPFNSQNTTWHYKSFRLLYLPSTCSFRMTDIWRGLIAQRIMHVNKWHLLFKSPTVYQIRNKHNLLNDFKQEIEGYTRYEEFVNILEKVKLKKGEKFINSNLILLYKILIKNNFFKKKEMLILKNWLRYFEKN